MSNPMSMEAMLDEERREVLALLEGRPQPRRPSSIAGGRSGSPYSPRSPVRSLLEVAGSSQSPVRSSSISSTSKSPPPQAPIRSMLDFDTPAPAPTPPVRSMLDIVESPPPSATQSVFSNPTSPTESNYRAHAANNTAHHRTVSDASSHRAPDFAPRTSQTRMDDYQFSDIITSQQGPLMPKRVSQGKKFTGSMAEVMRGGDVNNLVLLGPGGVRHSVSSLRKNTNKSKSPHNRLGMRSNSPHLSMTGRTVSPSGRNLLNETRKVNMDNAYRRLSDAHLARSGGSLSELPRRKRSGDAAASGRLQKDYMSPDGEEIPEESSDELEQTSSDEEDDRGRAPARNFPDEDGVSKSPGNDSIRSGREALSMLAAAEEERAFVATTQPYRSLLDEPEITVTNLSGEKVNKGKQRIHPASSFDQPPRSGSRTPMDSDEEADYSDIKRAQKLTFTMTPVMAQDPHRAVRIIYRGEYAKIQQEAEDEQRRLRKYLVATDLSDESTHALEWAIGTVLRDGDTLIAIYCVDEETGIVSGDHVMVADEPKAMKEQAAALNAVASSKAVPVPGTAMISLQQHYPSPLGRAVNLAHASPSPGPLSRERTKAEDERYRAVMDITDRVTRLLRKTRLQVRVIVEVLHCKNPKHLITEVIDRISPTLIILGSRGRSALKGVILGSFSNYLVTKSSVPVMVARKRLKKQSKHKKTAPVHQVNNLNNPTARSLANAKID